MIKKRSNRTSKPKQGPAESALKRVKATKLNLATLAANLHKLTLTTRKDLVDSKKKILTLEEKSIGVDQSLVTIEKNIDLCHRNVCTVNETIGTHIESLTGTLMEVGKKHEDKYSSLGVRVDAVITAARSAEECHATQYAAALDKIESLEERIPRLETRIKTLEGHLDTVETMYERINLRIVSVMRMSLAIIGVLMITLGVLGWIMYRH